MPDILLVETSLDRCLVDTNERRTDTHILEAFARYASRDVRLIHEQVHSVDGLRRVFAQAAEQNEMRRARAARWGTDVRPTDIRFVHLSSHGDDTGLDLPNTDGGEKTASREWLSSAFGELKACGIEAIFLSACGVGRNGDLATRIIEASGAKAVIGFPDVAYDDNCALAAHLFYFRRLLSKGTDRVYQTVRRVNDALAVLGVPDRSLMVCWSRENDTGVVEGPYPWWTGTSMIRDLDGRTYVKTLQRTFPSRGRVSAEDLQFARLIIKALV